MNCIIQLLVSLMEFLKVIQILKNYYAFDVLKCFSLQNWILTRLNFFSTLGIAIGGDVFPGSTLSDHVLRFNNIPQVNCHPSNLKSVSVARVIITTCSCL